MMKFNEQQKSESQNANNQAKIYKFRMLVSIHKINMSTART